MKNVKLTRATILNKVSTAELVSYEKVKNIETPIANFTEVEIYDMVTHDVFSQSTIEKLVIIISDDKVISKKKLSKQIDSGKLSAMPDNITPADLETLTKDNRLTADERLVASTLLASVFKSKPVKMKEITHKLSKLTVVHDPKTLDVKITGKGAKEILKGYKSLDYVTVVNDEVTFLTIGMKTQALDSYEGREQFLAQPKVKPTTDKSKTKLNKVHKLIKVAKDTLVKTQSEVIKAKKKKKQLKENITKIKVEYVDSVASL